MKPVYTIKQFGSWYFMGFLMWNVWGIGLTLSWVDPSYFYGRLVLGPIDIEIGRDKHEFVE